MKANLSNRKEKFSTKDRKENMAGLDCCYKVIEKSTMKEIVDCRIYWTSTFQTCTCCIWIKGDGDYKHGSGNAGGYGYHKQSAAVSDAIYNAGYNLNESISGVGDGAIENALIAIAKYNTRKQVHLIKCHS